VSVSVSTTPRPHPPEIRKRAAELARLRGRQIAQVAVDLGVAESSLRSWLLQAFVDLAAEQGLFTDNRAEPIRLRREFRVKDMEIKIPKRASAYFAGKSVLPRTVLRLVHEFEVTALTSRWPAGCSRSPVPAATTGCRGFGPRLGRRPTPERVPRWLSRLPSHIWGPEGPCRAQGRPGPSCRTQADGQAHANRRRPGRLPLQEGSSSACTSRPRGSDAAEVRGRRPDQPWCTDITEHPVKEGKLYSCAVLDAFSPRIVGQPIADHNRAELVVNGLQMATSAASRRPGPSSTQRGQPIDKLDLRPPTAEIRTARLDWPNRIIGQRHDHESIWSTMQRELLDLQTWRSRAQVASADFEWTEAFYNPVRRHSSIGDLIPAEFNALHASAKFAP